MWDILKNDLCGPSRKWGFLLMTSRTLQVIEYPQPFSLFYIILTDCRVFTIHTISSASVLIEIMCMCKRPKVLESVPSFDFSNQFNNVFGPKPFPILESVSFLSSDCSMTFSCSGHSKCAVHRGTAILWSHNEYSESKADSIKMSCSSQLLNEGKFILPTFESRPFTEKDGAFVSPMYWWMHLHR